MSIEPWGDLFPGWPDQLRQMWTTDIIAEFIDLYDRDIDGAMYKINDTVQYTKKNGDQAIGKILAVNLTEDHIYEYAIEGYHLLLWEYELREIIT